METSPCWKKIWLTVTGKNGNVTAEEVERILNLIGDDLCTGIGQYKSFTKRSFDDWMSTVNLKDKDNILETFIRRLSVYLDLETPLTWKVFCNFLIFEYHGRIADMKNIIQFEMYSKHIFQHIWLFYSAERMFMIKILKHVLEKSLDKQCQFYEQYLDYCKSPRLQSIQNNLLRQFAHLLNEIHGDNVSHCINLADWVDRNIREQIEILSSMILVQQLLDFSLDEYKTLLKLFKEHNFGRDPVCYQIIAVTNPIHLENLQAIEIGLLLFGFTHCWDNPNLWMSHSEELEDLFMSVLPQDECPIILLAWTTLKMTLPEKIVQKKLKTNYYKFDKLAVQQNVFNILQKITSNQLFQKCPVGKIIKFAVYVLLEQVYDKFIDNGIILAVEHTDCLIADLIDVPELAQRFILNSRECLGAIFETTAELFPITFESFTRITIALMKYPELFTQIINTLLHLQYYTEEFSDGHFDETAILEFDYRPSKSINIIVPAKSEAKVFRRFNKVLVTYEAGYSYFEVLKNIVDIAINKIEPPETITRSIYLGFKLIKILLDRSIQDSLLLEKCMDLVTVVFGKFTKRPCLDFKLIEVCMDIFISWLDVDETHVIEIFAINNFLPDIIKDPLKTENYFDKSFFVPGVLFMAIQVEIATSNYGLLFALIKLLKTALRKKFHHKKIQIPSIVLLLVHVFPVHLEWNYKDIHTKNQLTYSCVEILFEILQDNYALPELDRKLQEAVYNFCYKTVTNYEPFLKVFLRLLQVPDVYLHAHIDKEFDWNNVSDLNIVKIVKTCLKIVLFLYNKHNENPKSIFNTTFSSMFLNRDSKPCMLKIIAGYINHVFNKSIPKYSCQLLKKFASYPELPMLSLLEMNHYQIQCMFLEKIRDPLEDDSMKVLILELITVCLDKQNGLTAVFFNIMSVGESVKDGESIITFMEEYLQSVKESKNYLLSPVQTAVLDLLNTLWLFKKDVLISGLRQKEKFWSMLAEPLFQDLSLSNRMYSQIFNILMFELFKSKGRNLEITSLLLKIFTETDDFIKKWTAHIIGSLEENSVVAYGVQLVASWKHMLIAVTKFCPDCIDNLDVRHLLTQTCLDGLIQHFAYPDDSRVLTEWAELYLYLITVWPTSYYKDCNKMFESLARIFKYLAEYYENVNSACKEALFSIAIKTIQEMHRQIHGYPLLVNDYLHSMGTIFEKEYIEILAEEIQECNDENINEKTYSRFTQSHSSWFYSIHFLNKIMASVGLFIKKPICFPIAKIVVQCLINYAQSPLLRDFLYVDWELFFDKTKPPKKYINTEELSFKTATPWYFEEWWLTYSGIIQLMTVLVKEFGNFKLDVFFSYIRIHEDIIKNSLMLPMVTAECTAMQLVSACLKFCHALLKWKHVWKVNYKYLYYSYLQSINVTINAVCRILIRPRILKFFTITIDSKLSLVEKVPLNFIVAIMNQLMEVLGLCNLCLIKSGMDLISLLEPAMLITVDDVGIEYDFHVPKIYEEYPEKLNYGTVLCILHFFCKIISHISLSKPTDQIDPDETSFIAFVCPDFIGGYTISEKYNSVQTFAASEISGMSAPWLTKLDVHKVNFAIETLSTFLASQIFLTMHVRCVKYNELQYIKRELCSELLFFHEFIRKRMVEQCHYRVVENMVFRRLVSSYLSYYIPIQEEKNHISYIRRDTLTSTMGIDDEDSDTKDISNNSSLITKTHNHLKDLEDKIFYMTNDFEDICEDKIANLELSLSHTNVAQDLVGRSLKRHFREKLLGKHTWEDGCVSQVPIESISLNYPPKPPIVNEDYLLLLSHWFIFICNLSH